MSWRRTKWHAKYNQTPKIAARPKDHQWTRWQMDQAGYCESGKLQWRTKEVMLQYHRERFKESKAKAYRCRYCPYWHVTTKPRSSRSAK